VALSNKRRAFVEAYLVTWNASEAARRAGYIGRANTVGPRLLANVGIQEEIQRRLAELKMGADEVLIRLADQARADIGQFIDEAGRFDWQKIKERGYLVKGISRTDRGDRIELYDAQSALALIGKHHALFTERVEHSGTIETGVVVVIPSNGREGADSAPAGTDALPK
jgi:phage terminase small subunit